MVAPGVEQTQGVRPATTAGIKKTELAAASTGAAEKVAQPQKVVQSAGSRELQRT
jgi:hypothetical protein